MADSFEREEVEAVAACLGDDAAQLREENDEDERAANMERAASMLTWMLLTHWHFVEPVYAQCDEQHNGGKCADPYCYLTRTAPNILVRTEQVNVDLSAEMRATLYVLHPDGSLSPAHVSGVMASGAVRVCPVRDAACVEVPAVQQCTDCPERRTRGVAPCVRLLTRAELDAVLDTESAPGEPKVLEAIQRKFCEANGLTLGVGGSDASNR